MEKIGNTKVPDRAFKEGTGRERRPVLQEAESYEKAYRGAALKKLEMAEADKEEKTGREGMTQEEFEQMLEKFDAAARELRRRQEIEERLREEEREFRREKKKKLAKLRLKKELQKKQEEKQRIQKKAFEEISEARRRAKETALHREEQEQELKAAMLRRKEWEAFHLETGKVFSLLYGVCEKENTDLLLEERITDAQTGVILYWNKEIGPYLDRENLERLKKCSRDHQAEFFRKFQEISRKYSSRIQADSFRL